MKKEIVWVVGIGIVLGLIFAFGLYRINSSLPKPTPPTGTPNPINSNQEFTITLAKPEDGDVITQDSVTVTGVTSPQSFMVMSGESGDYILQTDSTGAFSQEVALNAGVNQIKITAFDPKGAQSTQKVLVVYSSSFQEQTIPTPDASSTSESDIRARVEQKVAQALNRPKAYLGTVTDISDSTIQIKSDSSQIEQISTGNDGITVINQSGKNNKTVKLTDIAIGDFIVAMGYINSNSVLAAQRILITDPVSEPKIFTYMAKVTDTSKNSLDVSLIPTGNPGSVTPDKNTDIESFSNGKSTAIKFATITQGNTLIYVLDNSASTPIVRSIFKTR